MTELLRTIRERKSVRTFDGRPVSAEDREKIDVGIAMCHFVMGLEEQGKKPVVTVDNPRSEIPENAEYIATVNI